MLGLSACGSDGEKTDKPAATAPAPVATSPEDQPGGAGDEEAARSEAVLKFSKDGLEPPLVRVAPFIGVKLIVRSVDGTEYNLSVNGPTSGGGANGSSETDLDLDGLRPGQKYELKEKNTGSVAAIVASDDVGP